MPFMQSRYATPKITQPPIISEDNETEKLQTRIPCRNPNRNRTDHAALWQIFSQVAKPQQTIPLNGERKDQKALYNFHETIINALRPVLQRRRKKHNSCFRPKNQVMHRNSFATLKPIMHGFCKEQTKHHLTDNRFRKLTSTSGSLNKNIDFQTINTGKRN